MKKRLEEFLNKPIFIIAIILLVLLFGLFFFNFYMYDIELKEYLSGIVTEILGIIITVAFVQVIFDRKNINDEKEAELSKIKKADSILQIYIEKYITLYYCVVTPMTDRDFKKVEMSEDFTLSSMRDLYKTSSLAYFGIFRPSIDSFIEIELELQKYMISMLENIDFKHHDSIREEILKFVELSLNFEYRSNLFEVKTIISGGEKLVDSIDKKLEQNGDAFYKQYKEGEIKNANLLLPYASLHDLMLNERSIINKYLKMASLF